MLFGLGAKFFWTFGCKKLAVWPNFRWMCPDALFEKNIVLHRKKTFFFFKHWAKHARKMPNFLAAFFKLHITRPEEFFRKIFLSFEQLLYLLRTFDKHNSERLSKLLSMSAEDRFERKRVTFKNFFPCFSDLDQTFLVLLAKQFWQGGRFAVGRAQGNNLRTMFFWKNFFFRLWDKNVRKRAIFFDCVLQTA